MLLREYDSWVIDDVCGEFVPRLLELVSYHYYDFDRYDHRLVNEHIRGYLLDEEYVDGVFVKDIDDMIFEIQRWIDYSDPF